MKESDSRDRDPIASHKRKYRRALAEVIQVLSAEVASLTKDPDFEASECIPGILLELTKINQRLIGMQELKD